METQILCVDPNEADRAETVESLQADLTDTTPVIRTAETVAAATETLKTEPIDCVITEYDLADGTGFDVIRVAREHVPDAGSLLYTDTDPDTIDTTELRGTITEYVGKDSVFGSERLANLIQTTVVQRVQSSYPLPQNESERVAALQAYDLDDPELEAALDRITSLGARHFDVDIASINIINEHSQEFMACHGHAEEWESMDREDSVCTFTILEDDGVMSIADVTEDPRFESRSDALIEMGIRSYLGANLVTSSGLVIGTLCIYDDEPRQFSPADESYLQDLAAVAVDQIEWFTAVEGDR